MSRCIKNMKLFRGCNQVSSNFSKICFFNKNLLSFLLGKVYKGEICGTDTGPLLVAIKTLKENATAKTAQDFRREVDLMSELRHPNIVCLLGVSLSGEPMCMLFEFMTRGDLHEFLMAHSPRCDVTNCSDEPLLDQQDFMFIALQIAAGNFFSLVQCITVKKLKIWSCRVVVIGKQIFFFHFTSFTNIINYMCFIDVKYAMISCLKVLF